MAINRFAYNGVWSTSYDFYISKRTKVMPKRRIDTHDLTGRNGAWVQDGIYVGNATITYEGWIVADTHASLRNKINNLTTLMYAQNQIGYSRLSDTYDDDGYMMAVPIGSPDITYTAHGTAATLKFTFSAKPEVYLHDGDYYVSFGQNATISFARDGRGYDTFPLIESTGTGTIRLLSDYPGLSDDVGFTITVSSGDTIIQDLETGSITFTDTGEVAASVVKWASIQTGKIAVPYFKAGCGLYMVTTSGNISGRIKPRWYRF